MLAQAKPTLKQESLQLVSPWLDALQAKHLRRRIHAQAFVRNALTPMLRFRYAPSYDYKIFCSHLCNRICQRFRCASSVAHSRGITCSITYACKASRRYESPGDGVTSCVPRSLAQSKARFQKSREYGSRASNAFAIAC